MPKNRLVRTAILLISLYLIVTTSKSIIDLWHSGDKLTRRERELATLKKDNLDLLRRQKRVESLEYLERVARDQLGLSKPGEKLIIIPEELLVDNSPVTPSDTTPNWQKWLKLIL